MDKPKRIVAQARLRLLGITLRLQNWRIRQVRRFARLRIPPFTVIGLTIAGLVSLSGYQISQEQLRATVFTLVGFYLTAFTLTVTLSHQPVQHAATNFGRAFAEAYSKDRRIRLIRALLALVILVVAGLGFLATQSILGVLPAERLWPVLPGVTGIVLDLVLAHSSRVLWLLSPRNAAQIVSSGTRLYINRLFDSMEHVAVLSARAKGKDAEENVEQLKAALLAATPDASERVGADVRLLTQLVQKCASQKDAVGVTDACSEIAAIGSLYLQRCQGITFSTPEPSAYLVPRWSQRDFSVGVLEPVKIALDRAIDGKDEETCLACVNVIGDWTLESLRVRPIAPISNAAPTRLFFGYLSGTFEKAITGQMFDVALRCGMYVEEFGKAQPEDLHHLEVAVPAVTSLSNQAVLRASKDQFTLAGTVLRQGFSTVTHLCLRRHFDAEHCYRIILDGLTKCLLIATAKGVDTRSLLDLYTASKDGHVFGPPLARIQVPLEGKVKESDVFLFDDLCTCLISHLAELDKSGLNCLALLRPTFLITYEYVLEHLAGAVSSKDRERRRKRWLKIASKWLSLLRVMLHSRSDVPPEQVLESLCRIETWFAGYAARIGFPDPLRHAVDTCKEAAERAFERTGKEGPDSHVHEASKLVCHALPLIDYAHQSGGKAACSPLWHALGPKGSKPIRKLIAERKGEEIPYIKHWRKLRSLAYERHASLLGRLGTWHWGYDKNSYFVIYRMNFKDQS